MINNLSYKIPLNNSIHPMQRVAKSQGVQPLDESIYPQHTNIAAFPPGVQPGSIALNTRLINQNDIMMYNTVNQILSTSKTEAVSPLDGVSRLKKIDMLLKNGILLNNKSNDGSTVLENLYKIATTKRGDGFDNAKILGQAIDTLSKPETVTQSFGDIPDYIKEQILSNPGISEDIKQDPSLLDVNQKGSGTCVSASFESHLARRHPAEFVRWANELTGPGESVSFKIKSSSLNSSYLEAYNILKNMFEIKPDAIDFNTQEFNFTLKPDKNAKTRALIQNIHWDKGERNILDVYMQSLIMHTSSEQSYDSLTDIRTGKFNANPNGLGEFEKIFMESIIENEERLSMVYQKIDENQNLVGWGCDFATIQKHIINTIDSGEDVIIGYVLTNETSGDTLNPNYVNTPENRPEKIVNGHEITIVDYRHDENGKLVFICNDTDDDYDGLIEYPADYLLPKIHHAGYPAKIVEADYYRITNNVYGIAEPA